ncbi:MAG TPA: PAS domain-containing protein [Gaiellaceae bacterium]|jgi:PAS domain-containing protein
MDEHQLPALADPAIQATLLAEAIGSGSVGFLVWDEDRHYIAANEHACRLLGCSLEELLGTVVGGQTVDGDDAVERVVRASGGRGRIAVRRFDGEAIELEYLTFATKTAKLPYMASIVWPVDDRTV